jgi:hypothetical protein
MLIATALVLHRIHDHDSVHECRQGCSHARRRERTSQYADRPVAPFARVQTSTRVHRPGSGRARSARGRRRPGSPRWRSCSRRAREWPPASGPPGPCCHGCWPRRMLPPDGPRPAARWPGSARPRPPGCGRRPWCRLPAWRAAGPGPGGADDRGWAWAGRSAMTSPSPADDPRGRPGQGDRRDLLSLHSEVDYVLPADPEAPSRTRSHGNQRGVLLSSDGRAGRPGSSGRRRRRRPCG